MNNQILKIRQEVKEFHDLKNTEENWIFYYDETDNCRKVTLTEKGFNDDSNSKIFVLGGMMSKNQECLNNFNFEGLKSKLKLKLDTEELKFKDIFKDKKDFLTILNSRKLETILKTILESDLYIHFYAIDLLYFSVVDIVDSLDFALDCDFIYIQKIKSELYDVVKKNQKEFNQKSYEFHYPNIKEEELGAFYDFIRGLIKKEGNYNLLKLFESDISDVPFIANNSQLINKKNKKNIDTIEHFREFYTSNLFTFNNSKHFFDKENFIEKRFEEMCKFLEVKENDIDYTFIDSKDSIFIQLSDVFVSVIKIYLKYLRDSNINPNYLQAQQSKNLSLLSKILLKSENLNKALIHNSLPFDIIGKLGNINGYYRLK
ncbi:MAG: DUF3800 domain-containing protein [Cetobacterium sp.]|uniref:DUF3800 domain-containing protein n=1 Tax=Cetobacterium sp. TaxID=2071632 RepID=UPI003F368FB8